MFAFLDIKPFTFNPPLFLALLFLGFVVGGGLLLKLPIALEHPISWIDAFFVATSAATVTGLSPADPGTTFTYFGKTVIMVLIQVGGLGVMSFAVLFVILLGRKVSIRQRQLMQEALNQPSIGGVIRLVFWLFAFSLMIECFAAAVLAFRMVPLFGWGKGLFYSIFHAVSAFNNAGFALFPDNLIRFVGDPVINLTITLLIISGGFGFTVLADLFTRRRFRKLSLHSRIMIVGTVIVNVFAIFAIYLIEYHNPATLGALSGGDKIWAAYFQGITPRTAGFNTIDYGGMTTAGLLLTIFLMFIGAGSTSTGGGIKLTTFIVILAEVAAFLKGKKEVEIARRTISGRVIARAMAIVTVSMLLMMISLFLLSLTEKAPFIDIVFEAFSAFGTVGLTVGLTSHLSIFGKLIIMCLMFFGKVGPLTLAFSFSKRTLANIRYPDEDILTG
ncbi:Ktr system potassium transporter B [Sporolactobacillus sp. THM7-7]|nr:Ktr system potassium transporter B [Sporolactobacillus sp. THM7-7]